MHTIIGIVVLLFGTACCTKLCQEDHWYNASNGNCEVCTVCDKKSLLLEPCADFKNTICLDLSFFKFDLQKQAAEKHKWHEMESLVDDDNNLRVAIKEVTIGNTSRVNPSPKELWFGLWDTYVFLFLCAALVIVVAATVTLMLRHSGGVWFKKNGNAKRKPKFRLFSRDRLSTTEYMNNLATLDRRLAMDEILEKRKNAIFDPQLLPQNIYADEVFVDISGLPQHYYEDLRIENDQDPTRSLLRTDQEQTRP